MSNVNYVYQWIVVDGGTETDVDGATASTYRLVAADQGKTITVRVSFADDVGTAQTLTSAATGTIQPSAATPAVTGVTVSSTPLRTSAGATSPDTYGRREHIEFTVQFHRAVTVIGTPTFTFMLVTRRGRRRTTRVRGRTRCASPTPCREARPTSTPTAFRGRPMRSR